MCVCGRATHLLIINWMGSVGDRLLSVFMSVSITLDMEAMGTHYVFFHNNTPFKIVDIYLNQRK